MAKEAGKTERGETQKVRDGEGEVRKLWGEQLSEWGGAATGDWEYRGPEERGWGRGKRGPRAEGTSRDGVCPARAVPQSHSECGRGVCVCVCVTVWNPNRRGCLRQSVSVPCVSMNFPSGDRSDPGSRSPTGVAGRGVRVFAALRVCMPLQVMT